MSRFDVLDRVPVPDQWDEIVHRSMSGPRPDDERDGGRRLASVGMVALASVVVLAVAVWAAGLNQSEGAVTATDPPSTLPANPDPGDRGDPALVCPDGGLVTPAIPDDATEQVTLTEVGAPPGHVRSWEAEGLDYELLMPGLVYIDFVGERTEAIADPEGMLYFQPNQTRFLGATGLGGPCSNYELSVEGADEATRVQALLATAATFEFDPAYGVTDCGELSSDAIQVTSGPTAMSAIRDVEVVDHLLSMRGFDFPLPTVDRLPDGRCTVQVVSYGGLRPTATISGRGGRYGLDLVRGFAPQGVGADGGTVQLDVPASVQVQGTSFTIHVDYWCGDCAVAEMTIHYPADGLTASSTMTTAGPFTGTMQRPPTAGSHGWIVVVWAAENGDARGIWTTTIASGDFAAG